MFDRSMKPPTLVAYTLDKVHVCYGVVTQVFGSMCLVTDIPSEKIFFLPLSHTEPFTYGDDYIQLKQARSAWLDGIIVRLKSGKVARVSDIRCISPYPQMVLVLDIPGHYTIDDIDTFLGHSSVPLEYA